MVRLIPWMLLLLLTFIPYILCLNQEGYALMAFKNSLQEDPLNVTSNWDTTQQNPCSWNGITCQQNKVVSLTFPRRQLLGLLPSILGSLTYLRHINLRNNNLNGTIPYELSRIMGLQSLILYGNFFSGSIPADIGNMKFIQVLDLSQNHLNGSIPSSLMKCTRLRSLVLSHNNFSGTLDDMFGSSFDELQTLDLSFNRLEGEIPSGIGNLSHVQTPIDLSHNSFSGSIPSSLGHIPENVYIDLSYNNLSGAIPQNGTLVNRGPTAFLENPGLCGPPLKNPCSGVSSAIPNLPSSFAPQTGVGFLNPSTSSKGLSRGVVIAIVLSDVFGIVVIAMVFMLCYWRLASSRGKDDLSVKRRRKECLCFRKDESDTRSENMEQQDLIPLDVQVGFDLDELLRASAFVLGKSGIGIVYKVVLDDGLTLAVRRLGEGGSQRFKEFQTEVEAIGRIRHQNIATLRAYYWSSDEKLLIYDYIQNGNLATAIHGKDSPPLLWEVRMGIAKGVAKGLAYLHEYSPKKYVHGDIKPTNILLGLNMEPYISDFGLGRLANIAGSSADQSNRVVAENKTPPQAFGQAIHLVANPGTLYQAPEAPKLLKPSQKWDVYSYGVILLELITGRSPEVLLSMSEIDLVKWVQVCIDEKKPFSEVLDPVLLHELEMEDEMVGVLKIALACVQVNPERRPSMRNISDVLDRLSTSN